MHRRRRKSRHDDDYDLYKWPPMPVTHDKHGDPSLDESAVPTPFDQAIEPAYEFVTLILSWEIMTNAPVNANASAGDENT